MAVLNHTDDNCGNKSKRYAHTLMFIFMLVVFGTLLNVYMLDKPFTWYNIEKGRREKKNAEYQRDRQNEAKFEMMTSIIKTVTPNDSYNPYIATKEQIKRQQRIRNKCQLVNSEEKKPKLGHLLYSDQKHTIYCTVPKVACTNWKRMMLVFENEIKNPLEIKDKKKVHVAKYKQLYKLKKQEQINRLNTYYSFLFVRHPFERILSAYRNKFLDPYTNEFQKRYGMKIIKQFRKNATQFDKKLSKNITFSEFVNYIIHCAKSKIPLDEHWDVINRLCSPCSMKYNFIGKMETLIQDSREILKQIGANDIHFPEKSKDKYKISAKDIMKTFYKQISEDQIEQLYNIYKIDFDLFGYSINKFYEEFGYR